MSSAVCQYLRYFFIGPCLLQVPTKTPEVQLLQSPDPNFRWEIPTKTPEIVETKTSNSNPDFQYYWEKPSGIHPDIFEVKPLPSSKPELQAKYQWKIPTNTPGILGQPVPSSEPEFQWKTPEILDVKPLPNPAPNFELEYQWQFVNFTWPSYSSYTKSILDGTYVPQNVAIVGIKYYKGSIYVAMPQFRQGIPVTLGVFPLAGSSKINPLIRPYPSWKNNVNAGDCATLQSVQSMEIVTSGIMWVLDGHRTNNLATKCPPKLVLIDLNQNGRTVLSYVFPQDVALPVGSFLNDLVVDESDGGYAYITDNSFLDPGLIVYSRKENRAWKLRDGSMFPETDAAGFKVGNATFNGLAPLDGIALSPVHSKTGNKLLFYSSLTALKLYSIETGLIKNQSLQREGEWRRGVKVIGNKQSQTDGMMMDNEGNLYYTLLPLDGVAKWNINADFATSQILVRDPRMRWPDSFALDDQGNLRLLTDNVNRFMDTNTELQLTGEVYLRIFKSHTGTKSYFY